MFTVGAYLALKITHSARILGKIQYFSHLLSFLQPGSQNVNFSFLIYCIFFLLKERERGGADGCLLFLAYGPSILKLCRCLKGPVSVLSCQAVMEREFLSEHSVSYNINKITVKYFLQAESPLACFLGLVMGREHTKLPKILVGFLMRTLGRQTDGRRVVTFPLRRCFTSLAAYPL